MNWPNESEEYRGARDELLQAEIELRRQEEAVAAQRRALPPGGEVTGDYVFDSPSGAVTFADLFANGKDTLYFYNFMFIPDGQGAPLGAACPSCTSILDAMDGAFRHLLDRVDVAIVAKAPIEQFAAWGKERGWRFAPLYSSSGNSFNRDYHAESDVGGQLPIAHVFTRADGRIHHRWSSELFGAPNDPGQHPRHVDFQWPIWKVLDVTPAGRGTDWNPRYGY
ncbi:MAG TPA: DUF899 family protein [Gaiellaceae bacterium]|nr:DUF899 family protein [Gaiellaceae bacterium]